jgi:magnesium-transporting ATPase (P-type)
MGFAGTLTQNEMVATRLWVAGYDRRNIGHLEKPKDVPVLASLAEAEGDMIDFVIPLGLDPRVYNLLCNSVALNSTANLRPPKNDSCAWPNLRMGRA